MFGPSSAFVPSRFSRVAAAKNETRTSEFNVSTYRFQARPAPTGFELLRLAKQELLTKGAVPLLQCGDVSLLQQLLKRSHSFIPHCTSKNRQRVGSYNEFSETAAMPRLGRHLLALYLRCQRTRFQAPLFACRRGALSGLLGLG